jgi:hypothetical protein
MVCPTLRTDPVRSKATNFPALWVSLPLAVLVAIAACAGLWWPPTYARESALWAAQGMGGDAVNLAVIVPVLLLAAGLTQRGSMAARLVWMGTLVFLLYNFAVYATAVHFNALFLAYCGILGGSFYALAGSLASLSPANVAGAYGRRAPVKTMAAVLFSIALIFAALWLREDIPALISGQTPKSITDTGLFTNPVHVLDLSLVLPGLIVTAIQLLRRRALAFVLAPVLMVFCILMTVAIAGMMVAMRLGSFAADYTTAAFFLASAAGCAALLVRYFLPCSSVSIRG